MDELIEELINEGNFRSLAELENIESIENLDIEGLYALRIKSASGSPEPFRTELKSRKTNLIYIGKAEHSICKRLY